MSHILVRYLEDGIFYLCKRISNLKNVQKSVMVKWKDRKYYKAEVLATGCKNDLAAVLNNLRNNVPVVVIDRLDYGLSFDNKLLSKTCDLAVIDLEGNLQKEHLSSIENYGSSPDTGSTSDYNLAPRTCNICDMAFIDSEDHLQKEHVSMTDHEAICNYAGPIVEDMDNNMKENHGSCLNFGATSNDNLAPRTCNICNTTVVDLEGHLQKEHLSMTDHEAICNYAGQIVENMDNNMEEIHGSWLNVGVTSNDNFAPRTCNICNTTVVDLEGHLQKEHLSMTDHWASICNYCGQIVEDMDNHIKENHNSFLDIGVSSNYNLAPRIGDICNMAVVDLESHLQKEHLSSADYGTFLCYCCGKMVEHLDNHMNENHNGSFIDSGSTEVMNVDSGRKKYSTKRHFCLFCETLQTKLTRHFERKHSDENEVREAMVFRKGSTDRKSKLADIQKKGDLIYNRSHNKPICLRRSLNQLEDKIPCPFCKGYYSKLNLRNHVRLNCERNNAEKRNIQQLSRLVNQNVHERASKVFKEIVFPSLRDDHITRTIAHDELVIVYANLLISKYSASHHYHKMIRNKIRHIGRILIEMQRINNNITDVASIYNPTNFDSFIKTVHNLAGLTDGKFRTPSFGPSSVTLLSQIGDVLQTEAIKKNDEELEKNVQRFMKLLVTTSNSLINKVAIENRTQNQRSQVVALPKTDDVKKLFSCLSERQIHSLGKLKTCFDLTYWIMLTKVTLVKIMIFNRKRPGDVEKSQIIEYNNLQMVDDDVIEKLDTSDQTYASLFGRYITRGKLDSPAPVLLAKIDIEAINMLLSYRHHANVENKNPYVFATPTGSAEPFYKAGKALSDFCVAEQMNNKNLSATKLRKHLATVTCTLQQSEQAVISDFMGHALNIHNKIYKQRPVLQDVQMGKFLNIALGLEHSASVSNNVMENIACSDKSDINTEKKYSPRTKIQNQNNEADQSSIMEISEDETTENQYLEEKGAQFTSSPEPSDWEDPDYQLDMSTIIEESNASDSELVNQTKKIMKHSKNRILKKHKYPIKKATWTTPERKTARNIFRSYLNSDNSILPTLETCQELVYRNETLINRAPNQVRAWGHI